MMNKLLLVDRYFMREIITTFVAVILVLLLILVSHRFVHYLEKAAMGSISGDIIFTLLGLQSLRLLSLILPAALFLSIILALGRMYRDLEMIALFASGISLQRVYRAVLLLAIPLALLTAVLTWWVVPLAMQTLYQLKTLDEQNLQLKMVNPGRFHVLKQGDLVFYVEQFSKDERQLKEVFIQHKQQKKIGLVASDFASSFIDAKTGQRYLELKNGIRYQGVAGRADYQIIKFSRYVLQLKQSQPVFQSKRSGKSMQALWSSTLVKDSIELHARLGMPVSVLLFAMLAVPLSRSSPREGKYGKLLVGVLVYLLYFNLIGVMQHWLRHQELVMVGIGMWWLHGVLFVLVIFLWFYDRQLRGYA